MLLDDRLLLWGNLIFILDKNFGESLKIFENNAGTASNRRERIGRDIDWDLKVLI